MTISILSVRLPRGAARSLQPRLAPPIYRPKPLVSQPKLASPIPPAPRLAAPPVFRPQALVSQLRLSAPAPRLAAPPVFRPQALIAQAKPSTPAAPPVYRPQPPLAQTKPFPSPSRNQFASPTVPRNAVVQRIRVGLPQGVKLTGGNGVSVLWSGKNEFPHVSVVYKPVEKSGLVDVSNFHYTIARANYIHWDDKSNSTTFTLRGGMPSKKIFDLTQKQATKFGITLTKPPSVRAEEDRIAAAEQAERLAAEAAARARHDEEAAFARAGREAQEAEDAFLAAQLTVPATMATEDVPDTWE
jgi:hypothetical protein